MREYIQTIARGVRTSYVIRKVSYYVCSAVLVGCTHTMSKKWGD